MCYYELTYGAIFVCFVLKGTEKQVVLLPIINQHWGGSKMDKIGFVDILLIFHIKLKKVQKSQKKTQKSLFGTPGLAR